MGIVSGIIADAYLEAKCNSDNVPAAPAIKYCDDIYQELIDQKKLINEDFIKKTATLDTRIYKNKYPLPTDFEKMKQISIKYSAPTYTARAGSTAYVVGDKVTYNGKSYICTNAHTSGAIFENNKTFTTNAIMIANETVTINGVVFTAKAAGAAVSPGDFAIGISQTECMENLYNCINSATSGSATTFIALSTYNKNILAKTEIVATNPTLATVVIKSNDTITTSETSTVGSRSTESDGNFQQIYEGYKPCTPRTLDFDFVKDFNNISESNPIYFYDNNDLYIYPYPKTVVTQGILFDYIPSQEVLTTTTDDGAIEIENKLHDAWIMGTASKFAGYMQKPDLKAQLEMEYQKGMQKCINRRKERHYSPIGEELPSSLYKYMR